MRCPKCDASVAEQAAECPRCGIVLAKAGEAMDRAFLRRQSMARQKTQVVPEPKASPWPKVIAVAVLLVCAFGAWQWYTDDTTSDLDRLAAEVRQPSQSDQPIDGGRTDRRMLRLVAKFGIAIAIFAIGYMRLKASLSP